MGIGLCVRCPKCKKKYHVATGMGFLFPDVYREVVAKVRGGLYGKKLKLAIESTPFAAVDAEVYLYVCQCGWWKTDYGL